MAPAPPTIAGRPRTRTSTARRGRPRRAPDDRPAPRARRTDLGRRVCVRAAAPRGRGPGAGGGGAPRAGAHPARAVGHRPAPRGARFETFTVSAETAAWSTCVGATSGVSPARSRVEPGRPAGHRQDASRRGDHARADRPRRHRRDRECAEAPAHVPRHVRHRPAAALRRHAGAAERLRASRARRPRARAADGVGAGDAVPRAQRALRAVPGHHDHDEPRPRSSSGGGSASRSSTGWPRPTTRTGASGPRTDGGSRDDGPHRARLPLWPHRAVRRAAPPRAPHVPHGGHVWTRSDHARSGRF